MQSKAKTVKEYLASLPEDRRKALETLRQVILKNIDSTYIEHMSYGMPGWSVPHSVYPPGYHCDPSIPLPYAGYASQKNHMSLYLMCIYGDDGQLDWFRKAWAKTGKKLDMGKSCIRFKRIEDVPLDVVAEAFRRTPAKKYIEHYEASIQSQNKAAAARAAAKKAAKQPAKQPAKKTKR